MKLKCKRESIQSVFQTAAAIAPTRSPKAILQSVKIEATKDRTILIATDMEVGIRVDVADVEVQEEGSAILPVGRFGSILRENGDESLTIHANERGITVKGDRSQFKLPSQNPDEFPTVREFDQDSYYEVSAATFKDLIRKTLFATDTESSRYALGGVLFEFSGDSVVAVGTDGRRMATMQGKVDNIGGYEGSEVATIVPAKSLAFIDKAIPEEDVRVKIATESNDILITTGSATIYSRLVDGRFPKWRDVIQVHSTASIEFHAGSLHSAVRQAAIVSSDDSRGIDFCLSSGSLVLSGQTADVGESRVELPADYDGEEIVMALDHRYVADFLRVLGSSRKFSLNVSDGDSAALCTTDDGYSYMLMPLAKVRAAKVA